MIHNVPSTFRHAQAIRQVQQVRTAFQALGNDLQSGNLSNAQSDYAAVAKYASSDQRWQQLGRDLQSGNLAAAQNDYALLRQPSANVYRMPGQDDPNPPAPAKDAPGPLRVITNLAATAVTAYATGGLAAPLAVGSLLRTFI